PRRRQPPTLCPYTTLFRSSAASGTDAVRDALNDVKAGRALLRFIDIGRAIEFKAGAGALHAETADLKGPGPKVDATSLTWLGPLDRKSTRLNSSHQIISYA